MDSLLQHAYKMARSKGILFAIKILLLNFIFKKLITFGCSIVVWDDLDLRGHDIRNVVGTDFSRHATRHRAKAADELFDQNLNTADKVKFKEVEVGDLKFANNIRLTEDPEYGLVLVLPSGRRFALCLREIRT